MSKAQKDDKKKVVLPKKAVTKTAVAKPAKKMPPMTPVEKKAIDAVKQVAVAVVKRGEELSKSDDKIKAKTGKELIKSGTALAKKAKKVETKRNIGEEIKEGLTALRDVREGKAKVQTKAVVVKDGKTVAKIAHVVPMAAKPTKPKTIEARSAKPAAKKPEVKTAAKPVSKPVVKAEPTLQEKPVMTRLRKGLTAQAKSIAED